MKKEIKPFVSAGTWSYIINQNKNAMRITLMEYGSCTPINILREWINNLSQKEIEELADECDRKKDIQD